MSQIKKRVLLIYSEEIEKYSLNSLKKKFDEIIDLSSYLVPLDHRTESLIPAKERLPVLGYDPLINTKSKKTSKVKTINKIKYVKLKELDLGEDTAYFCIGKMVWYYLRDFHNCHVGLRNTNKDWQINQLEPFSMGSNKFVFCHGTNEHYRYSFFKDFFFDDEKMLKTIPVLTNKKTLYKKEDLIKGLKELTSLPKPTRFGLDYETTGLWRKDKYELLKAIGFGIATKSLGYYFELRDLTDSELEEVKLAYREFLETHEKNIWVFNVDYELLVTRKLLGDWATYEFQDADVFRIMYGDQVGYSNKKALKYVNGSKIETIKRVSRDQRWSLKYTAQKYLNVPSWDDKFEELQVILDKIFKGYKIDNVDDFLTNPLVSNNIHSLVSKTKEDKLLSSVKMTRVLKRLCAYKKLNTVEDIEAQWEDIAPTLAWDKKAFKTVILGTTEPKEVYNHPLWKEIVALYPNKVKEFKTYIEHKDYKGNPYAVQPKEVMGEYCILDSYYTVMIAERQFEIDYFTPKGDRAKNVDAKWATTEKLVEIFNSNKVLGALLNMHGLYKSNKKRDSYNKTQESVRVFSNYVLAKGWINMMMFQVNIQPHPNQKMLNTISISCIERGLDPTDFNRVTKTLFKEIYDDTKPLRWNDSRAESILGKEIADQAKDILIDYKPKGFIDESAYSRSTNLHKEVGAVIKEAWKNLNLPDKFDWTKCKSYFDKKNGIREAKEKLVELETFNIKGLTHEEVSKLDNITYTNRYNEKISMSMSEMVVHLKKEFFDVATASELELGVWFERWKLFRILLALYDPKTYKDIIDNAGIFNKDDSLVDKLTKFQGFIGKVYNFLDDKSLKFKDWESAYEYAKANNLSQDLQNPDKEDLEDNNQSIAYQNAVLTEVLNNKFKINYNLVMDSLTFLKLSEHKFRTDKEALLTYQGISPLSYINKQLSEGRLCKLYDGLVTGDSNKESTLEKELLVCDIDSTVGYKYYPIMATMFKIYRKFDKLGQYLNGQLVDNDYELLDEGQDGVPSIGPLTKEEKDNSVKGDKVKVFPSYEIMQKITKRNSSGIHTIPGASEVKGVIEAPEDSFLVYTDISSMELRGIAAISNDETMIQYFESGKDIYTEAAMAYHVEFLKKDFTYDEVRALYRNPYKIGVISTIYTASDRTLAKSFGVEVFEVREIKNAIFNKFVRLYEWQNEQIKYNKNNSGYIKTFFGDVRKSYDDTRKQARQAVNMDVQGTCSLVATAGFNNIITQARKKRMILPPAVIVHDAVVAYSKAKDMELLYNHYQESFYDYLSDNFGFRFPFDLEIAVNYYEKTILERGTSGDPREFTIQGTNRAVYQVLTRAIKYGKKIEFLDGSTLESIHSKIDDNYKVLTQYFKTRGNPSFNRDFSYGKYNFKFTD